MKNPLARKALFCAITLCMACGMAGLILLLSVEFGLPFALKDLELAKAAEATAADDSSRSGVFYETKAYLVNLADADVRVYAKAQLAIEFASPTKGELNGEEFEKEQKALQSEMARWAPMINDHVLMTLSAMSAAELLSADGKERLKGSVMEYLNSLPIGRQVQAVYLTDLRMGR